ncbi:MAG: aspartyl/asparaginyl beta-hydroxylase domain-containing protein [Caulobacteraceae bacterium]
MLRVYDGDLQSASGRAGAENEFAQLAADSAAKPTDTSLLLRLAGAAKALGRDAEEDAALFRLLQLQPRHLEGLFQAADLYERRGQSAIAAAVYRTALQSIPASAQLPPEWVRRVQTARAAIDANNGALERFLGERLAEPRARFAGEPLGRIDKARDTLLLKRRVYRPQPSFLYVPEIPAVEFFDRALFPWLGEIEAAFEDIRAELMAVMAEPGASVQPYIDLKGQVAGQWAELNNSRRWSAFFLWREGEAFAENQARCPRTMAALEAWPRCEIPGAAPTAMFSILEPRTRIPPHVGVNNARVVVHLPLVIPKECGFRVGAETRPWVPGQAFVFDDTIEHEAWNDSDDWRAVLIIDVWNPFVTAAEREMVAALTDGVNAFYGELPDYIRPQSK